MKDTAIIMVSLGMSMNKGFRYTICLSQQEDGRWYGRLEGSHDGQGNECDCLTRTAQEALEDLLEQGFFNHE